MGLGRGDKSVVDHINGNGLDNRKANLRIASATENGRNRRRHSNNTSGFKGVKKDKGRWVANIGGSKNRIRLGSFETPEEAHAAYCEAANRLHGEFARHA